MNHAGLAGLSLLLLLSAACTTPKPRAVTRADWTSDHIMIGARWQPDADMRVTGALARVRRATSAPALR